jgi:hypothetical protein
VSASMGIRLEGPGVLARFASPDARIRFVERLVEIPADRREPEVNKASAAGALFTLAPPLDSEQASRVNEVVEPLPFGKYGLSQWVENLNDPLSRFKISLQVPHQLRATALGTIAHEAVIAGLGDGRGQHV